MSTWLIQASTEEYKQAIEATESLTKDSRAVGFIKPHEFSVNLADTNIQRQNNTLIHLLIQNIEQIKELKERVQILSDEVKDLKKGKTQEVSLPDDVVEKLSKQLADTKVGNPKLIPGKARNPVFRVWK
jgi:hypothetical protein